MSAVARLEPATLEAVCKILADTSEGLTGGEIGALLAQSGISDPEPGSTKWRRLLLALSTRQNKDGHANGVLGFLQQAMHPARYVEQHRVFEDRRAGINRALAFAGIELGEDGKLRTVTSATTISEAVARAGRLRSELQRREVHAEVLKACRSELLEENYFHAVLEATKSLAERIRSLSGLNADGSDLVNQAFGTRDGAPLVAFNSLRSMSEDSEHRGLMQLMKGVFAVFRNPTAHELKTKWAVSEREAFDLLTMVSILHRRLDGAVRVPRR